MFVNLIPSLISGPPVCPKLGIRRGEIHCLKSLLLSHYTFHLNPVQHERASTAQKWPHRHCPFFNSQVFILLGNRY